MSSEPTWHSTTILAVKKGRKLVVMGDGQVSMGQTVMKGNARKVRRIADGRIVTGFAGATADAFTLLERFESAEQRVDVPRVGDVIAVIGHGGDVDRVEPDRVDAEQAQMIQTREDTAEVTDSVTVAVGEGPRIHLIEDGVGPPLRARGPGSVGHANPLCRG